jgi:hypothetical protein
MDCPGIELGFRRKDMALNDTALSHELYAYIKRVILILK